MKVIGKENVDYISRKSNQPVKGISFHCTKKRDNVEGLATQTVFVSKRSDAYEKAVSVPVGSEVEFLYDQYGSVYTVQICK